MDKWEYTVWRGAQLESEQLNDYGNWGWELVFTCLMPGNPLRREYTFKRKKQEEGEISPPM